MSDPDISALPEPLKAAVAEFEAWMQAELLADQARSVPLAPLYHYTDKVALEGILEKKQVWCFLHSHQSDRTEVQFSMDIARRVIREEADRGIPPIRNLLLGLDDLLDSHPLGETFDFYFFSLSSHHDDSGQWEEYGRKGTGFCIGFSPTLFQPDQPTLLPRATENIFVSKVIYGRDATRTRHRRGISKITHTPKPSGAYAEGHGALMQRRGIADLATNPQLLPLGEGKDLTCHLLFCGGTPTAPEPNVELIVRHCQRLPQTARILANRTLLPLLSPLQHDLCASAWRTCPCSLG
jgi:hypothetical protein